jgi:hypothetical protein
MTTKVRVTVFCDTPGCDNRQEVMAPLGSNTDYRQVPVPGWKVEVIEIDSVARAFKHRCPKCLAERKQDP